MDETLRRFEAELTALLSHLTTAERKKLARSIGQRLRQSQFARLRAQQNPDGSPFTPRKKGFIALRREMTLLIDGEPVHLTDVRQRGQRITGIDAKRRQKRSVQLADIQTFLESKKTRITARRLTHQQRMFKKLATARFLRLKTDSQGINLAFLPSAARIARVHHFGLTERYHGKTVHYPTRQLLGLTAQEMIYIENQLLDFLTR
ncbi:MULTISPECIES: phage virion morphogenesis protein [Arsenophonus]|uniref:phage virion morphogenesis protein n=1 Tax=Arsenophonus TaxID=637 RepID=UPI0015D8D67E|nr:MULTISPECIES: phage virion morphogenesis protein [Arsenophonus]UBX30093.1 phage virion morphogenesis protein [Arsenophonus apicola]